MRLLIVFLLPLAACATAQPDAGRTLSSDDWCARAARGSGDPSHACEVRETVLTARRLQVDAGPNGGIVVNRWDRPDVLVRARVAASGPSSSEADRLVGDTAVETAGGRVRARVPGGRAPGARVSVSYEIFAPRHTDLALQAVNGGLSVDGIAGDVDARTVNGGVALRDVAGAVRARTTNGGVTVDLAGPARDGAGLDVATTNGGIAITLPRGYSARLAAETQTGRVVTSGLDLRDERRERGRPAGDRLEGTLGRGDARLSAVTTNGGVSIRQGR